MHYEFKDAQNLSGEPLKYALLDNRNSGAFRTKLTPRFEESLQRLKKNQLPLFDLWSLQKLKLVAADFDQIPKWCERDTLNQLDKGTRGKLTKEILWKEFRSYLSHRYGRLGLVLPTPSGKAKILFVLLAPAPIQMTHTIALDTLQFLLEEGDFAAVDKKAAALNRLYVNREMLLAMQTGLEALPAHEPILDSLDQEPGSHPSARFVPWDLPLLGVEERNALGGVIQHEAEWFIVRFMAGMPTCALESIALPRILLSKLSSLRPEGPFGQAAFSRAIKALMGRGLLVLVDDTYVPGKKAKLYRAEGVLHEVMARLSKVAPEPRDHEVSSFLGEDIPDGQWTDVLWKATNYFRDEASYLAWAYAKEGVERKNRKQKAREAWRNHVDPRFNRPRRIHPTQASGWLPEAI